MAESIDAKIEGWDGLAVVTKHDEETGAWIFIALHDVTLGTPLGGTRMKVYPTKEDGLEDALRLAEGMTFKWASIEVPFGGGKAVIALPKELPEAARTGLLERYARLLNALNGSFGTGQDLGTTAEDMAFLAKRSRYIHGVDPDGGEIRDPGPYTARGVLAGMRAACEHRYGSPELSGRTVLIQGVGDVGGPLAGLVANAGGEVLVSDVDEARAAECARSVSGETIPLQALESTECHVFAPCAIGAILNEESIPRLRCEIVAGSANNQLREDEDAVRLHERGILYAPDYVVNAGGAMAFASLASGVPEGEILERVERIHGITAAILREAAERNETPLLAAQRRAREFLHRARGS